MVCVTGSASINAIVGRTSDSVAGNTSYSVTGSGNESVVGSTSDSVSGSGSESVVGSRSDCCVEWERLCCGEWERLGRCSNLAKRSSMAISVAVRSGLLSHNPIAHMYLPRMAVTRSNCTLFCW